MMIPHDEADLPALWAYCSSPEYSKEVRRINKKLSVTNATLAKVPFDRARWRAAAQREFPHGLPEAESHDPTQWVFHGRARTSSSPLQVAVCRLLGYRWPLQVDDGLADLIDDDGIVCLPSVRGERPAVERLRSLLAASFGQDWSPEKEADLLANPGYGRESMGEWLRDGFFEQHCQLFDQRPLVWHIWDGRKDGFAALIKYHRLDRANLEKLIFTYLGGWIRQQRDLATTGVPGADSRLAAAQELQKKLELILEGEPPYDIFVRWKPLEEQPMGWEPDLNDGVRLNIRPFVTAGVLRKNPNIKWGKDRGRDADAAPWYSLFKGDRINDHHVTLAEKRAAREATARRTAGS
jgi:hypothetical protein